MISPRPARHLSTSPYWQGPLFATLISLELVRALRRATTLLLAQQMSRKDVYISIPFPLITVFRCDESAG